MELFIIYLWLKLDTLIGFLIAGLIFGAIAVFLLSMFVYIEQKDEARPWRAKAIWLVVACCALLIVVPSSKQVAILVGANYGLDVAKSPEGQKVWLLIRGKANELLDEELKNISAPKEKKK